LQQTHNTQRYTQAVFTVHSTGRPSAQIARIISDCYESCNVMKQLIHCTDWVSTRNSQHCTDDIWLSTQPISNCVSSVMSTSWSLLALFSRLRHTLVLCSFNVLAPQTCNPLTSHLNYVTAGHEHWPLTSLSHT